ncbi:hypothetical protein BD410DRAFT_839164 [Rickenella mellea]|uniref:Zn(2)-C6 fungal-type domain-containing protein n=1 Tax=Rickenella mellea TaxID=50990 RepID=A0A4Y7Q7H6_9AGAM|nr:hypothetical protein BD410DRAFT_839164 [Rickenella mellea]
MSYSNPTTPYTSTRRHPGVVASFENEPTFHPSTADIYAWGSTGHVPTNPLAVPPRRDIQAADILPSYSTPSTYGISPPTISRRVDNLSQSHVDSFPEPTIRSGHTTYNAHLIPQHSNVTRVPYSATNGANARIQSAPHQPYTTFDAPQSYAPTHDVTDAGQFAAGSHGAERPHSTKVSSDDRTPAGQRTDKPKKNVRPCGTCQSSKHKCDMEPPYSEHLCRNCGEHGRTCTPHVPYSVAKDRLSRPSEEPAHVNGFEPISPTGTPTIEQRPTSYQYNLTPTSDLRANSCNSASLLTSNTPRQGLSPSSYDPNTSYNTSVARGGGSRHEPTQTRPSGLGASQPRPTPPFSSHTFRS